MTKGRADAANWVTSYTLHYSTNRTFYYPIQQAGADVVSLVLSYKNRNDRIQHGRPKGGGAMGVICPSPLNLKKNDVIRSQ